MRSVGLSAPTAVQAQSAAEKGLSAFWDRQGALANGPPNTARCLLWAAPTKQGEKIARATTRP